MAKKHILIYANICMDRKVVNIPYTPPLIIVNPHLSLKQASETPLPPGEHIFGFQCNIPASAPTSLEAVIGYIRYLARVVLKTAHGPEKEFFQAFTVIKTLDLNNDPALRVSYIGIVPVRPSSIQIVFFVETGIQIYPWHRIPRWHSMLFAEKKATGGPPPRYGLYVRPNH